MPTPPSYKRSGAPARGSWATHPLEHQIAFINNERRRLAVIEAVRAANAGDTGDGELVFSNADNSGLIGAIGTG